jgi:hypothetical protein
MTRNEESIPALNARVHKIGTARSVPSKENVHKGKSDSLKKNKLSEEPDILP